MPAGAIPKDGPSAGVTMFTSLLSLVAERPVPSDLAMTGEITLRGKVLPVGGIKEKVLAAKRAGVKRVILPDKNEKDLRDLPEHVINAVKFQFVSEIDELIRCVWGEGVIVPKPTPPSQDDRGERRDEALAVS